MLLSRSFSTEQNEDSPTRYNCETDVSYHQKFTRGFVEKKYMDSCLYVINDLEAIVAGEVGFHGLTLVQLIRLLGNYLIPGSRIEVVVSLWISPNSQHFKAKTFVLSLVLEKCPEELSKITKAVEQKKYEIFVEQCLSSNKFNNYNAINWDSFNCIKIDKHDFSEEKLTTDYNFETKFIDYSGIPIIFKIKFTAS